ncbi:MAG: hypothetical protein AB7S70_07330 [Hyphomicrobium sp.]
MRRSLRFALAACLSLCAAPALPAQAQDLWQYIDLNSEPRPS